MKVAVLLLVLSPWAAAELPVGEDSAKQHSQAATDAGRRASSAGAGKRRMVVVCQTPPAGAKKTKNDEKEASKPLSVKESAEMRQLALKAIRNGKLGEAEGLLREGGRAKERAEREAWMLVEAEYRLAKKQPAAAGLAAMRLAILRPDSERVGEALYWAARSYEGLKRPHKAIELYGQCLAHKKADEATRKLAKARLDKLEKQAGDR